MTTPFRFLMPVLAFLAVLAVMLSPTSAAKSNGLVESLPADAELTETQARLLDLAIEAASKMPHQPHIKNRSRAQEHVAMVCLDMEAPRRAHRYMMRIDNWRRGAVATEIALYLVKRGHTTGIEGYLRVGEAYSKMATQNWRREYIDIRAAQVQMLLGNSAPAEKFERLSQEMANDGRMDVFRTEVQEDLEYDRAVSALNRLVETKHYDPIMNATHGFTNLYERYYSEPSKREQIEDRLRQAYEKMPGTDTIKLLLRLGEAALVNGDSDKALGFVEEAYGVFESLDWPDHSEYEYEFWAKIIALQHKAGDEQGAVAQLNTATRQIKNRVEDIVEIWRGNALRPLAEVSQVMGDGDRAAELYAMAVEHGMVNVNSRPRARDISASCASMALHSFEPDDNLWALIHKASDSLGPPW